MSRKLPGYFREISGIALILAHRREGRFHSPARVFEPCRARNIFPIWIKKKTRMGNVQNFCFQQWFFLRIRNGKFQGNPGILLCFLKLDSRTMGRLVSYTVTWRRKDEDNITSARILTHVSLICRKAMTGDGRSNTLILFYFSPKNMND